MKKYQIKNTIGSGNFSTVYSAQDVENHQLYAVKIMKTHPKIATRQAHFLNKMKHPNVIELIQFQQNQKQSKLVLEHVGINTLELYQSHSYGLRQQQVKCILFQAALGLAYIHSFGIIHRDIKPENLLIDKKNALVKIIDFGLAINDSKISTDYIATRWYRAPQNLLSTKQYTTAIDVFSLGCVIVELYLGSPLFPGSNNIDQLYKIFNILGEPTPLNWSTGYKKMIQLGMKVNKKTEVKINLKNILNPCNSKLIDLIHKMLILNPKQRINCQNIVTHEYFKDIKNIIPPLVFKKFQQDYQKNNDPLTFRGFHQVKNSTKMSIKETIKSIDSLKNKYNSFRSQEPRQIKQKSSSIDSTKSINNNQRIQPLLIRSIDKSLHQRPRFKTNINSKTQESFNILKIQNKNKLSLMNKTKAIKDNLYLSEYSRLATNQTEKIKYSKNQTQETNFTNKINKSQQNLNLKKKKNNNSIKGKGLNEQKNGSPGYQKYSPKYLERIKNQYIPKMIRVQNNKNNPLLKYHLNLSPSNTYHYNHLTSTKKKKIQQKNKQDQYSSSSKNQHLNGQLKKQKYYTILRNSDQEQGVNINNNYKKQSNNNVFSNVQRNSMLDHYKSFDNLHKDNNQTYLRKSPQITTKNYPTNFNKFNFYHQQRN